MATTDAQLAGSQGSEERAEKTGLLHFLFPFLSWLPMVDGPTFRIDLLAGIAAGVLILPQAIALATLAELPPELGLYTAMFPVIIACLWGSSWHVLSGPNTAISVVIAMIISGYAGQGTPDFVMYAITMTFLVGVIQVLVGVLRLGVIFNYFSHTVMVALVTGVGMTIIVQQIGNFLGLLMNTGETIDEMLYHMWFSIPRANIYATSLGVITVATGIVVKKYLPEWPYIIVAVVVGMIAGEVIDVLFPDDITRIDKLGYLSLSALPLSAPDFSPTNFYQAAEGLIMGSMMIAFLGLMQSAVIARAIAVKSGQHVNMNQEVTGQGLSNIVGSFLSCYPSCGSFNRSANNFETGARTPLAGIISALALGGLVYVAAPVIAQLPLAVMAGVLVLVGWGLGDMDYMKKVLLVRGEARVVFLLTLGSTLYGGLQNGVFIGIFLSIVTYLRAVSRPDVSVLAHGEAEQYLPDSVDPDTATVIQISGSIFFGSSSTLERAFGDIGKQDERKGTLVIAGEYIDNLDDAGAGTLVAEVEKRDAAGGSMHLWLRNHDLDGVLDRSGLMRAMGESRIHYIA